MEQGKTDPAIGKSVDGSQATGSALRSSSSVLPSRLREMADCAEGSDGDLCLDGESIQELRDAASALEAHDAELDNRCDRCRGLGRRVYGSTATWRGGIGGQMMTEGVCDKCWGSGDATRPYPSWREREAQLAAHDAEIATVRRERDAAHAHACELVLEAKDRDVVIATLRAELDEARRQYRPNWGQPDAPRTTPD